MDVRLPHMFEIDLDDAIIDCDKHLLAMCQRRARQIGYERTYRARKKVCVAPPCRNHLVIHDCLQETMTHLRREWLNMESQLYELRKIKCRDAVYLQSASTCTLFDEARALLVTNIELRCRLALAKYAVAGQYIGTDSGSVIKDTKKDWDQIRAKLTSDSSPDFFAVMPFTYQFTFGE